MNLGLRFLPGIEQDVLDAFAWYESNADGLGEEFLRTFYAAAHALPRQPRLYAAVHGSFRRCLLSRFPYAVYYRVNDEEIVVYGVFHCARSPRAIGTILGARDE